MHFYNVFGQNVIPKLEAFFYQLLGLSLRIATSTLALPISHLGNTLFTSPPLSTAVLRTQ